MFSLKPMEGVRGGGDVISLIKKKKKTKPKKGRGPSSVLAPTKIDAHVT